ncbi:MAG: T9SS type A sorting domain-containing protein [Bacteroidales bacterium]|nr:T9SS type A sorting domain-containing protein [Bacteroidales bacterium]
MKKTVFLFMLLAVFCTVQATINVVTLTTDDADNPTTGMLRYWIENANDGDTIIFTVGTVNLDTTIRISGGVITIDGGDGVIIDAGSNGRVFSISSYDYDDVTIKNLIIQNGRLEGATSMGGGMYVFVNGGSLLVDNCIFKNNVAVASIDGQGGGLRTDGGIFQNCYFLNNSVTGTATALGGGGILAIGGIFINCVIAGNNARFGGGVYSTTLSEFLNCTITQNAASESNSGGGVYCEDNCSFNNTIIYNNTSNLVHQNIINYLNSSSFSHCAVESSNSLVGTNGNIGLSSTPFIHTGEDSLCLHSTSSCIDAGSTSGLTILDVDIAGNPRINGDDIDIGAYEYQIPLFDDITVNNSSLDPDTEYSLPWAIIHAADGCNITFGGNFTITLNNELDISKGITIDGTGHTIVLDGNNHNRIFDILLGANDTMILRNLIIQNGHSFYNGGGINCNNDMNSMIFVINCVFDNNSSEIWTGGGIYIQNNGVITNCTFVDNSSYEYGGGVVVENDGIIINTLFYNNNAAFVPSAYSNNCTFINCASNSPLDGSELRIWSNPFIGGIGNDRFQLVAGSNCANAGSLSLSGLMLPSVDLIGNSRIQNDTIDIGAYECNYYSVPAPTLYSNIVVTNNSFDGNVSNSIIWALAHADNNCTITFDDDYAIDFTNEIYLGDKSLTIDGTGHSIVFNGGNNNRLININGSSDKKVKLELLTMQNGSCNEGGGALIIKSVSGFRIRINKCYFLNNTSMRGGALRILDYEDTSLVLTNCIFKGNNATDRGGAFYSASSGGGWVGNYYVNCTFTENTSLLNGSGGFATGSNIFCNCLFYNNISQDGTSVDLYNGADIRYCAADAQLNGNNNIRLYYSPFTGTNLHLSSNSYCCNAGTPDTTGLFLSSSDFEGNSRIINDTIDIGAIESNFYSIPPPEKYDTIIVINDSFDMSVPYSLPWALQHIGDSGMITFNGDYQIDVSSKICLGAYSITIDGGDNHIILDGGDSIQIVEIERGYTSVLLKNLVFQRGHGYWGGALSRPINTFSTEVNVMNCLFYKNSADSRGGAVHFYNEKTDFYNCVFLNNHSEGNGGALFVDEGNFFNCTFVNNTSKFAGGAAYVLNPTYFVNTVFYGNTTGNSQSKDVTISGGTFKYCAAMDDITGVGEGNILLTSYPFEGGGTLYDSLMLISGSVLINAGNPDLTDLSLPSSDFRGINRVVGDTIDIGAYEYYDHIIETYPGIHGHIEPELAYVLDRRDQDMLIIPDNGFQVDSVWVDDTATTACTSYTFENVVMNHTIAASFLPDTFTLRVITNGNGMVTPSNIIVTYMDTTTLNIYPYVGYRISRIEYMGLDLMEQLVEVEGSYYILKITDVYTNDTLFIDFDRITYRLVSTVVGLGGAKPADTTVYFGDPAKIRFTPAHGYKIDYIVDDTVNIMDALIDYGYYFIYSIGHVYKDYNILVVFTSSTSIGSDDISLINILPNPAKAYVWITIPNDMVSEDLLLKVYNINGENILSKTAVNSEIKVDLSGYKSGEYIITLYNQDTGFLYSKIIILQKE